MALTLSAETEARISQLVAEGQYPDADSFLNVLMDSCVDEYGAEELAEIRVALAEAEEQSARGEGIPLEVAMAELRTRFASRR